MQNGTTWGITRGQGNFWLVTRDGAPTGEGVRGRRIAENAATARALEDAADRERLAVISATRRRVYLEREGLGRFEIRYAGSAAADRIVP